VVLLLTSKGLSPLAVAASLIAAAIVIYVVMALRLREHMRLIAREDGARARAVVVVVRVASRLATS
jgi:hypothetical protein